MTKRQASGTKSASEEDVKRIRKAEEEESNAEAKDICYFWRLSSEIQQFIWRFVDDRTNNNLHLVCRDWHTICRQHFPFRITGSLQLSVDGVRHDEDAIVRVSRSNFNWNCDGYKGAPFIDHAAIRCKVMLLKELAVFLGTIAFSEFTDRPFSGENRNVIYCGDWKWRWIRASTLQLQLHTSCRKDDPARLEHTNELMRILAQCKLQPKNLAVDGSLANATDFGAAVERLQANGSGLERIGLYLYDNGYSRWYGSTPVGDGTAMHGSLLLPNLVKLVIKPRAAQAVFTLDKFLQFIRLDQEIQLDHWEGVNLQCLVTAVMQWNRLAFEFNEAPVDSAVRKRMAPDSAEPRAWWTIVVISGEDLNAFMGVFGRPAWSEGYEWRFNLGVCKLSMKINFAYNRD